MLLLATTLLWNTSTTNTGSQNVPIRSGSSENSFDLKVNHYKSIKAWVLCALSDLSTLASGLVTKNRALGLWPHALFLATRPEARADKSDSALEPML